MIERLSEERLEKIRQLILSPPPNSKIAEAKEFGIDLTLQAENLRLTPQERIEKAQMATNFLEGISREIELSDNNLGAILKSLTKLRADFIIVGEVACYIYGWKHISPKLELLYSAKSENLKKIVSAIAPFNPRLRGFSESSSFVLNEDNLPTPAVLKLSTEVGDIDLLSEIEGIGDFAETEKLTVSRKIYGVGMRVISLDALIKTKRAAGRAKDLLVLPELEALKELLSETEE